MKNTKIDKVKGVCHIKRFWLAQLLSFHIYNNSRLQKWRKQLQESFACIWMHQSVFYRQPTQLAQICQFSVRKTLFMSQFWGFWQKVNFVTTSGASICKIQEPVVTKFEIFRHPSSKLEFAMFDLCYLMAVFT